MLVRTGELEREEAGVGSAFVVRVEGWLLFAPLWAFGPFAADVSSESKVKL